MNISILCHTNPATGTIREYASRDLAAEVTISAAKDGVRLCCNSFSIHHTDVPAVAAALLAAVGMAHEPKGAPKS